MMVELGIPVTSEVYFSKSGLQSIIQNLVSNAVKYKSPDRKLKVQISLFNTSDYQILSISDNGLGIDLEKYGERLYNLYQRFHPETEGKGLGLYLVRSIIESAGGRIEVESEVNVGTTFKLYFPNKPLKY
jgi:signal transduction histidine kinase